MTVMRDAWVAIAKVSLLAYNGWVDGKTRRKVKLPTQRDLAPRTGLMFPEALEALV